jgi:gamma-glutamylaminecyclotransferase
MHHLVFVFGTLKEGFPNFPSNRGVRKSGAFLTKERYPFYLVGERHSPWLIDAPGEGEQIVGQVFEVDQAALEAMDKLERVSEPDGYRRIVLEVTAVDVASQDSLSVFAYLKQAQHLVLEEIRFGPFPEYTVEHAALYRSRA